MTQEEVRLEDKIDRINTNLSTAISNVNTNLSSKKLDDLSIFRIRLYYTPDQANKTTANIYREYKMQNGIILLNSIITNRQDSDVQWDNIGGTVSSGTSSTTFEASYNGIYRKQFGAMSRWFTDTIFINDFRFRGRVVLATYTHYDGSYNNQAYIQIGSDRGMTTIISVNKTTNNDYGGVGVQISWD